MYSLTFSKKILLDFGFRAGYILHMKHREARGKILFVMLKTRMYSPEKKMLVALYNICFCGFGVSIP